jgi:plasmid stabilization system protein ParE
VSLRWSDAALADLIGHHDCIARDSEEGARKVVQAILDAADGLLIFPQLGKASEVAGLRERVLARLPYTIVYRVVEDRRDEGREPVVELARVLHNRQEWP